MLRSGLLLVLLFQDVLSSFSKIWELKLSLLKTELISCLDPFLSIMVKCDFCVILFSWCKLIPEKTWMSSFLPLFGFCLVPNLDLFIISLSGCILWLSFVVVVIGLFKFFESLQFESILLYKMRLLNYLCGFNNLLFFSSFIYEFLLEKMCTKLFA